MALLPPTTLAVRDGSFLGSVFYELFKVHARAFPEEGAMDLPYGPLCYKMKVKTEILLVNFLIFVQTVACSSGIDGP